MSNGRMNRNEERTGMIITLGIFLIMGFVILYGAWIIIAAVFLMDRTKRRE